MPGVAGLRDRQTWSSPERSQPSRLQARAKALRGVCVFGAWKESSREEQRQPAERGQMSDWLVFLLSRVRHCSEHLKGVTSPSPHSSPMRYLMR